jgi:hypothetical protein
VTSFRLKYIHRFKDRHGHVRHYFRRPGRKPVALPGLPSSAEFMAAYQVALAAAAPETGASQSAPGTFNALAAAWYRGGDFANVAPSTKITYRRIVDAFLARYGEKPVVLLEARHIHTILDGMSATPAQANKLRSILRLMLRFAVERGWRADNPAAAVGRIRYKKQGFPTWTDADLAAFEARWPVGTRERLAFELLLMTGQRRVRCAPAEDRDDPMGADRPTTPGRDRCVRSGGGQDLPDHPVWRPVRQRHRVLQLVRRQGPFGWRGQIAPRSAQGKPADHH